MKTFAIAGPDRVVRLWCTDEGTTPDGSRKFSVINGLWDGTIDSNGVLRVAGTKDDTADQMVVWEGTVPHRHAVSYNTAIPWIQAQVGTK